MFAGWPSSCSNNSKCSVAVWNGHQVELLKNTRNQKGMRSYVMFKDDTLSAGVTGGAAKENAHQERMDTDDSEG